HLGMGKTPARAAYDGAGELTLPVLLATLATIIVLTPLAFSPGIGGFLFRPLTLAVTFAMIASFVLAWTFVPTLCSKLLKPHDPQHTEHSGVGFFTRFYRRFDTFLKSCTHRYAALLQMALRHRGAVLALTAALFGGSLVLIRFIGREFFP